MRAFERTGDGSLLALARYFIEERGQRGPEGHYFDLEAKARGVPPRPGPGHGPPYSYHQADRPIRELASVEGHAVRAMYVSVFTPVSTQSRITHLATQVLALWGSRRRAPRGRQLVDAGCAAALGVCDAPEDVCHGRSSPA